jgi:hypothetical protein
MDPAYLSTINEVLDRIQIMSITDGSSSIYEQIGFEANHGEFCVPPTTHLVATIEDLTDMLDYASEEADDMDEDIDVMSYSDTALPTPTTGKWTTTSTYDVYMVDTAKDGSPRQVGSPKEEDDDPKAELPKRRRQKRRSRGRGRGREGNTNSTGDDETLDNMEELGDNTTLEQDRTASEGHEDRGQPVDLDDSEDSNYLPASEEEDSLGPEDFIIPEDPLDQEKFKRQLIATTRSLKKKQQLLKAD